MIFPSSAKLVLVLADAFVSRKRALKTAGRAEGVKAGSGIVTNRCSVWRVYVDLFAGDLQNSQS